jgi:hypothetical protein
VFRVQAFVPDDTIWRGALKNSKPDPYVIAWGLVYCFLSSAPERIARNETINAED